MTCPHCTERVTLRQLVRHWFTMAMPYSYYMWRERREHDAELAKLKRLYTPDSQAVLTARERLVCILRISDRTLEQVAESMNVTRERVRQIQAKAVRKLERDAGKGIKTEPSDAL